MSDIPSQHVIIVRADLTSNPGGLKVDIGTMSPTVAALVLQRAVDALEIQPEPVVTIIHDDVEIATAVDLCVWTTDDDDDDE